MQLEPGDCAARDPRVRQGRRAPPDARPVSDLARRGRAGGAARLHRGHRCRPCRRGDVRHRLADVRLRPGPPRTCGPAQTGITAANVGHCVRQQVQLPGTVDSSPIYLHAVKVGRRRPTTRSSSRPPTGSRSRSTRAPGRILWRYHAARLLEFAGSAQITTMTPVADPSRTAIYAGAPDGRIRKLSIANGHGALVDLDHAGPDAREARLGAQLRERARARRDRRLHRRRAARTRATWSR